MRASTPWVGVVHPQPFDPWLPTGGMLSGWTAWGHSSCVALRRASRSAGRPAVGTCVNRRGEESGLERCEASRWEAGRGDCSDEGKGQRGWIGTISRADGVGLNLSRGPLEQARSGKMFLQAFVSVQSVKHVGSVCG
uniref:Uncharacterized protein n=1 Tax=Arundo donax TaxID=35708 RepID=A0A0A9AY32_ARUDO